MGDAGPLGVNGLSYPGQPPHDVEFRLVYGTEENECRCSRVLAPVVVAKLDSAMRCHACQAVAGICELMPRAPADPGRIKP